MHTCTRAYNFPITNSSFSDCIHSCSILAYTHLITIIIVLFRILSCSISFKIPLIVPRDSEYSVDIMNTETILHFAEEEIVIAWNNVSFYPPEFNVLSDELDAEVTLQQVNPVDGSTSVIKKWMLPNSGKAALIIPNLLDYTDSAIPAEIVIHARQKSSRKRNIVVGLVRSALYTSIRYVAASAALRIACEAWSSTQGATGNDILDRVNPYPCPPRLDQITRDNSGFQEDFVPSGKLPTTFFDSAWRNFFHPESAVCYRQSVGFE